MQASRKYARSKSKALKIKEFSLLEKLNNLDKITAHMFICKMCRL